MFKISNMKKFIIASLIIAFIVGVISFCAPEPQSNANEVKRPEFSFNYKDYDIPELDYYRNQSNQNSYESLFNKNNYEYNSWVYITQYGECYHKPGCSHAKKSAGTMSRSTASKKGYRACYYCFG